MSCNRLVLLYLVESKMCSLIVQSYCILLRQKKIPYLSSLNVFC